MHISKMNKNRYFYEYAFWQIIDQYNTSIEDKKQIIHTREARGLRRSLEKELKTQAMAKNLQKDANTITLNTCSAPLFCQCVNNVLQKRIGYMPYTKDNNAFRTQLMQFSAMSGVTNESDNIVGENHFIPISPYDTRFSWRKALVENGSRLGSIKVNEVDNLDVVATDVNTASMTHLYSMPRLFKNEKGEKVYMANDLKINLLEDDDKSGLTLLMPYMTQAEYAKIANWVNQDISENMTMQDIVQRQKNMQKSIMILYTLNNAGRAYTISKDEYPGQIKANITGTKVNVRLTEKHDTQEYIGSVYDDGARYIFSTTRKENNLNRMHNPTGEDVCNLLKFALGESVKRKDSDKYVGENEILQRGAGKGAIEYNASYVNTSGLTAVYADFVPSNETEKEEEQRFHNKVRMIADTRNRTVNITAMLNKEDAENYLKTSIQNARENYLKLLDVDRLIDEYAAHQHERELVTNEDGSSKEGDLKYVPIFSGDPNVAVMQKLYWDVLTGEKMTLIKPFKEKADIVGDIGETSASDIYSLEAMNIGASYNPSEMTKAEIIRQHALDSVEKNIGTYLPSSDGLRFDPIGVATYDPSGYGIYRNNNDIVKAVQLLDIKADELRGNDTYNAMIKDRLIKFDPNNAKTMKDINDPFVKNVYNELMKSLQNHGVTVDANSVLIDNNGIVQYQGKIAKTETTFDKRAHAKRELLNFTGQIGQIFVPDKKGVVKTQYAGSDNFAFVPGYTAHIRPQNIGESKTMEERTILHGYQQKILENIRYQILQDVLDLKNTNAVQIGATTSINNTYKGIEATRYDLNFEKQFLEQSMPQDILDAIIKTQLERVRYANEIRDGSSINADFRAKQYSNFDYANDNYGDPYSITGNRNISVLTEESDGYFDPIATTSTSVNQGAVRYLVEGTIVNNDGTIIPSKDKNARCAIFAHDVTQFSKFDPFDRQCMMLSNVMQANAISEPTKSMDISVGSWTQDDAIVVTKSFAEKYKMRKNDGSLRPLVVQDKLSDMHGNKGVISYVLDPDKNVDAIYDDAKKLGFDEKRVKSLIKLHELAKKNPDVEIFMAPFTQPSRFNAGTAREKMTKPFNCYDIDGNLVKGGGGEARFIITDKSVENKTHIYDEKEVLKGKGRKASGQLAWALTSKNAKHIMREFFGTNTENLINMREYLLTMGLDITETGDLVMGYQPHSNETRNVFHLPKLQYVKTNTGKDRLDVKTMANKFVNELSSRGGIIELPFSLKYPTGEDIPPMDDGKRDVIYKKEQWERKGYTRKDGIYVKPTTVTRQVMVGQRQTENVTWGLPVMSAYLRSGQELVDGTSIIHDYTSQYLNIYKEAIKYLDNKAQFDKSIDAEEKNKLKKIMKDNQQTAQEYYNNITKDLEKRKFEGKHNMFKENIMTHRLPNSATSVWSPDPRLAINQIAVGLEIAEALGIDLHHKEPQGVLVWRDPILHDSNVRYMEIVVNPNISGCAINPNIDKPFDGDFDGDTVALVKLNSKVAQREAQDLFSVGANLIDTSHKIKIEQNDHTYEVYPLNMNDSLDIKVAQYVDPSLKEKWMNLTLQANALYQSEQKGEITGKDKIKARDNLVNKLSDYYYTCADKSFGKAQICYDNLHDHLQSVYNANIKTGAKGSPKKVGSYAQYLGAKNVEFSDTDIKLDNLIDNKTTFATREMQQGVMIATNVKNVGTGFAGAVSQRAMRAIGDIDPKVATELTYPVTQSVLQSKHDPIDAKRRFNLLLNTVRKVWDGKAVKYDEDHDTWLSSKEQANPEQWKKSFIELYTSDHGMGVEINSEYVDKLTKLMTDEMTNKMKSVEIEALANNNKTEGALLYKLAYGGSLSLLIDAAQNKQNLFAGNYVQSFEPITMWSNQFNEISDVDKKPHKILAKSDTLVNGKVKNIATIKPATMTVNREVLPVNNLVFENQNDNKELC